MILRDIDPDERDALQVAFAGQRRCILADAVRRDEAAGILRALQAQPWKRSRPAEGERIDYAYSICTPATILADRSPEARSLARLICGVASLEFREFVRAVTGVQGPLEVNARVSRYADGDFIGPHYDAGDEKAEKRLAYVFDFSVDLWDGDGGVLAFPGQDGLVEQAYKPRFNSLILFATPQYHYLSKVRSPTGSRFTITGWFSDRKAEGASAGLSKTLVF